MILMWIALLLICAIAGLEFWLRFVAIVGYIIALVIVNTAKICGVIQ